MKKIPATIAFVLLSSGAFSQVKIGNGNIQVPKPQQLQNSGLNNTRSNKEQRYAPVAPAPPAPAPQVPEKTVPDSTNIVPDTNSVRPKEQNGTIR